MIVENHSAIVRTFFADIDQNGTGGRRIGTEPIALKRGDKFFDGCGF